MIAALPRRSALYMPAANARAIEKARDLACDVVILDLEDAVAPDAKDLARRQAVEAVKAGGFGRREVVIRVNGLDTPWGAAACGRGVAEPTTWRRRPPSAPPPSWRPRSPAAPMSRPMTPP